MREIVGIQTADTLLDLDRQGQQQRRYGGAENNVGQSQGLHDGVDRRPGMIRQTDEHRGVAAFDVADLKDEHVRG